MKKTASMIAESLNITGPFNIQFLSKDNEIKVPQQQQPQQHRRSRPHLHRPLCVRVCAGDRVQPTRIAVVPVRVEDVELQPHRAGDEGDGRCGGEAHRHRPRRHRIRLHQSTDVLLRYYLHQHRPQPALLYQQCCLLNLLCCVCVCVRAGRLAGADPALRVEMSSTGEVACFGDDRHEAYLKGLLATGFKVPKKTVLVSTGPLEAKIEFISSVSPSTSMRRRSAPLLTTAVCVCVVGQAAVLHELGFAIYATRGTHSFLCEHNVPCTLVEKPSSGVSPNAVSLISDGVIDMVGAAPAPAPLSLCLPPHCSIRS